MTIPPTTTLSTGPIVGRTARDGVVRYLGIPYAEAPFGARRFQAPAPVAAWTAPREATAFGPTAPQAPYQGAIGELLGSVEIPGDDILTANVWAPAEAHGAPVVLWLHGGALERGTPALSIYDGTSFARDGIVFISVAYRLGSEGFSVLDGAAANPGLLDAAAGLAWAHREAAAFGGDPSRITVMGESSGGALTAALLARPESRRLIAGAIIESGPLETQSRERAGRVTRGLAKQLGIPATLDGFRAVAPERLVAARVEQAAGSSPLGGAPGFGVTTDDGLPVSPHEALRDVDVPILIGTNTDEYRLWFAPEKLAKVSSLTLLLARLALRIPARAVRAFRRTAPGASTGEVFGQIATDLMLRAPALRLAGARTAPTYVYEFAWPSPVRDLRAAHALELGFVFDALGDPEAQRLAGPDAPQHLADEMHAAWVRFIRTGDPGWPAYGPQRLTRIFDTESRTEPARRQEAADALH